MTEKVAKKIGEAYAFAQVLQDTLSENTAVMQELLGDHARSVVDTTTGQKSALGEIATKYNMIEIVLPKSERTAVKIKKMADMYVGDDWDDVAEVLEWMSFFVGGAIVHWQLITGSATEMNDESFKSVADMGTEYYNSLMNQLRSYSVVVGTLRAQ